MASAATTGVRDARSTQAGTDALSRYLRELEAVPLLDREAERRLAERVRAGDRAAEAELLADNLRFVTRVASRYRRYGLPLADLIQAGNLGLLQAMRCFDPLQGVSLRGFAIFFIRAEINEYVIRNWRIVIDRGRRRLSFRSPPELAREPDGPTDDPTEEAVAADDRGLRPSPRLPMEIDPIAAVDDAEWLEHYRPRLAQGLARLDRRARRIIQARWLCDTGPGAQLSELAREFGISCERVRQMQNAALRRLRRIIDVELPYRASSARRLRAAG